MAINCVCWNCRKDTSCRSLKRGIIAPAGAYVCIVCWQINEAALAVYDRAVSA